MDPRRMIGIEIVGIITILIGVFFNQDTHKLRIQLVLEVPEITGLKLVWYVVITLPTRIILTGIAQSYAY